MAGQLSQVYQKAGMTELATEYRQLAGDMYPKDPIE